MARRASGLAKACASACAANIRCTFTLSPHHFPLRPAPLPALNPRLTRALHGEGAAAAVHDHLPCLPVLLQLDAQHLEGADHVADVIRVLWRRKRGERGEGQGREAGVM
eukprot:3635-Chlamydomonas_euryale.AAC.5